MAVPSLWLPPTDLAGAPQPFAAGGLRRQLLAIAEEYERLEARLRQLEQTAQGTSGEGVPKDLHLGGSAFESPMDQVETVPAATSHEDDADLGKMDQTMTIVYASDAEGPQNRSPQSRRLSSQQLEEAQSRLREVFRTQVSTSRTSSGGNQSRLVSRPTRRSLDAAAVAAGGAGVGHSASLQGIREHWLCRALDPNSAARLLLDGLLFMVCIHDTAVVPISLAWSLQPTIYSKVTETISLTLWATDLMLNFFTGYLKDGLLITDLRAIRWRYITTTFPFDFTVTSVDFLSIVFQNTMRGDSADISSTAKVLRLLKLSKLARAGVLVQRSAKRIKLTSNSVTLLGLGLRLVAIVLCMNHLICCAWFWLGQFGQDDYSDTGSSWLDMKITSGGLYYRDASPEFQYLTSFHWALTQMTPGSMSVVPQNSVERSWNILCLVMGLFISSLLISQLSAKMVRVQTLNHDRLVDMDKLRRFLGEQAVPRSLAARIQRQVQDRLSITKPLTMQDLPLLGHLPTTLKQELACAIFAPSFLRNLVFYTMCLEQEELILTMATRACELEACSPDDDIFSPSQEGHKLYCLQLGCLSYQQKIFRAAKDDGDGAVSGTATGTSGLGGFEGQDGRPVELLPQAWISTIALWCNWTYLGCLTAVGASELVAINVDSVINIFKKSHTTFVMMQHFAQAYSVLATAPENAHEVDLDIQPSRVLMAMSLTDRGSFSKVMIDAICGVHDQSDTLRFLPPKPKQSTTQIELLSQELADGKCVMTLSPDGHLLRTVLLCVLSVRRVSGELLYQLATCKQKGQLKPDCVLPGSKLRAGESADRAAHRVTEKELPPLQGRLRFRGSSSEEVTKKSQQHGVRTMYLKTKFEVAFVESSDPSSQHSPVKSMAAEPSTELPINVGRTGSMAAQRDFPVITPLEAVQGPGKYVLFAWLHPADHAFLTSAHGAEELKGWLKVYEGTRQEPLTPKAVELQETGDNVGLPSERVSPVGFSMSSEDNFFPL